MADSEVLRIKVQGEVYELDFEAMTWGELGELEELLGGSLEEANLATARGVLALAFIAARRKQPAITMDSLKALPMSEIELVDEPVPTSADEVGEDGNSGNQA
ncbi:MAG: hypothetical protein EBR82_49140 [Caulobacteraceae bacterium]|nr:hypothetical protein [Caulobacteraceae bacterium]